MAIIGDAQQLDSLWEALDRHYAMWDAWFDVRPDGAIFPKASRWRKSNIWKCGAIIEVYCFVKGWMAGRNATLNSDRVYELRRRKRITTAKPPILTARQKAQVLGDPV